MNHKILIIGLISGLFLFSGCEEKKENLAKTPETLKVNKGKEKQVQFVIKQRKQSDKPKFSKPAFELLTIKDVKTNPKKYNGKRVKLVVKAGINSKDNSENLVPLLTRSDCYVHDKTGTLMLSFGWQYKNSYNEQKRVNKDYIFNEDHITIQNNEWIIEPIVYEKKGKCILSLKEMKI
jgi:hypothetical protein